MTLRAVLLAGWLTGLGVLGPIGPSTALAQQALRTRSAADSNRLATLLYQSKATEDAALKAADARLIPLQRRVQQLDAELAKAKQDARRHARQQSAEAKAYDRRIAALEEEAFRSKLAYTERLAELDLGYRRERSILIAAGEQLLSTPEGRRALDLYNQGGSEDWSQAKTILDRISKVRRAADRRAIATLYRSKRDVGQETTAAVIEQYEWVVSDDPAHQEDWLYLALLYWEAGRPPDGIAASNRAIELSATGRDKARAISLKAHILHDSGNISESLAEYEAALRIQKESLRAEPTSVDLRIETVQTLGHIAFGLLVQGKHEEALDKYREATIIVISLVQDRVDRYDLARETAIILNGIGDIKAIQEKSSEALEAYEQALAIFRFAAEAHPAYPLLQDDVARTLDKIGDVHRFERRLPDAVRSYRESLAIRSRLADINPSNAVLRQDIAFSHYRLAAAEAPGYSWKMAVDHFERLRALRPLAPNELSLLSTAREGLAQETRKDGQ